MNPDPFACSLPEPAHPARRDLLRRAAQGATVTATDRQVRWSLDDPARLPALVEVVEAERRCCPDLRFTLVVDADAVSLTVDGPAGTRDVIADWLPGVPAAHLPVPGSRTLRAGLVSILGGLGVMLCCVLPGAAAVTAAASIPLLLLDVVGGGAVGVGVGLVAYGAWHMRSRKGSAGGRACDDAGC